MDVSERSSPSPEQPSAGREALLRATVTVVARGGLRALTYRAVAEEAGVAHALVWRHFGSRSGLIVAATEYTFTPTIETTGYLTGDGSPGSFGRHIPQLLVDESDVIAFQYEVMLESRRQPALREAVDQLYARYRAATSASLAAHGVEADSDLATLVFAALDGIVLQGLVLDDVVTARRSVRALQALLAAYAGSP